MTFIVTKSRRGRRSIEFTDTEGRTFSLNRYDVLCENVGGYWDYTCLDEVYGSIDLRALSAAMGRAHAGYEGSDPVYTYYQPIGTVVTL